MEKTDSLARRKNVIKEVIEAFTRKGVDPKTYEGRHYILWIEAEDAVFNDLTASNRKDLTLRVELLSKLEDEHGIVLGDIETKKGNPEGEFEKFMEMKVEDVALCIETKPIMPSSTPSKENVTKARITLAPSSPGALKQPEGYVIDSEHAPYNIGRVIEPGDPINRVNDIEIVDDSTPPYVSRTHAHIGFSTTLGFYIQREKVTNTNKTKVISKNSSKIHDLYTDIDMGRLSNDDTIVLSNYVRLLFQLID